jgi:hypothetical protein
VPMPGSGAEQPAVDPTIAVGDPVTLLE